jgi:adenosylcobinamide-GDP ribazoletransferase
MKRLFNDFWVAVSFFTRLPIPTLHGTIDMARALAFAPLVGVGVGLMGALAFLGARALGLPVMACALIAIAVATAMTGALHEDGLADCADGLGGRNANARLEIMKDSRIGSYGTLALLLITLIRWSALTALVGAGHHWPALIAAGALSRAPMAVLIATLPNARGTGLSHLTGRPPRSAALAALGIAAAIALLATGLTLVPMALAAAATTALLARAAIKRIGGQTGDILGASQQLAEAAALALAAAHLI